ncbi:hypothetical protein PHMEG_00029878 [Phytophthora megakarya]|uniref:Uncharacterized protein n=1 Tax=Phytophthora megakarya TaxID=4795 RepID=A0A225V1M0_9STRA|nr:hypothetical protein PHMEG_00029878 [Phytophthora megakarya]
MQWNIALTALARDTRFKNPRIVRKVAETTSDTKQMCSKWEATVYTFVEKALVPRKKVPISQFKNKLNAIRTAYRAKITRLLATRNQVLNGYSGSEGENDERAYPEMPSDFYIDDSTETNSE